MASLTAGRMSGLCRAPRLGLRPAAGTIAYAGAGPAVQRRVPTRRTVPGPGRSSLWVQNKRKLSPLNALSTEQQQQQQQLQEQPQHEQQQQHTEQEAAGSQKPRAVVEMEEQLQGMGLADTDLESRPIHYFWVLSGSAALAALFCRGLLEAQSLGAPGALTSAAAVLAGYVLADLGTGFYHFGVDNYGSASTPVFGPQIDAFQGHHRRPWTITKRQFANNLHALARPVLFTVLALSCLPLSAGQHMFFSTFLACVMLSQQFHAWAHTPKNLLPQAVVSLQDAGVLVSRKMHGAHHKPPFNSNYCIVSGICNRPLDHLQVFSTLEKIIYTQFGVASRSWGTSAPDWLQSQWVSYYEDGRDDVE